MRLNKNRVCRDKVHRKENLDRKREQVNKKNRGGDKMKTMIRQLVHSK